MFQVQSCKAMMGFSLGLFTEWATDVDVAKQIAPCFFTMYGRRIQTCRAREREGETEIETYRDRDRERIGRERERERECGIGELWVIL